MLSIPVIAMASISFYAGLYHLWIYARSRNFRAHLTFSILCFTVVTYDAFCVGLYNSTSLMEGASWQKLQFIALALFVPAFLWFVADYTNQKPGRVIYIFSLFYAIAFLIQLIDHSNLTLLLDQPSIKDFTFLGFSVTYYEVTLGPFSSLQSVMGLFAVLPILVMGVRHFKNGHRSEATALIVATGLMYIAGFQDMLVSNGAYHFVYLMEYAYLATILMMTSLLSRSVVDAAIIKEELRKSEEWFRSLVETTSDWVWEVDASGKYTYASPKVRELLGYEPEEMIGRTPIDFMIPDDAQKIGLILQTKTQNQQAFERLENANIRKDGQIVVLETSGIPYFSEKGELLGYRGIDRDITERKRAEEELHQSQQMLLTVLDQFPGMVYWKDRQSAFLGCNQASAIAAGLTNAAEIIGKTDFDLPWAATEAANYRADDLAVMESGQPRLGIIEPQHRADGSLGWLDTAKVPLLDGDGEVIGILGTSRDITDQVHTLHTLQETEFFLNRSQQVGRIGSYKFDARSGFWECSPSLDEILGIDQSFSKDVDGWLSLVDTEDRDMMQDHMLHHVLRDRQRFEKEYRIVRPSDGESRWVFGLGELEFDDAGEPVRMIGTIQDITDRKKAEAALQQATLIVENSPVMLIRWRAAEGWPVVLVSQNITQFGYISEEFLSGSIQFASIVHPDDLQRVGQEVQDYTASGVERFLQEYRILTKDGQVRWVEDRTMVERNADGLVTHFQGLVVDITERKQVEEELRQNQQMLRTVLDQFPGVVFWKDLQSVYLGCNQAFSMAIGLTSPTEIVGMTDFDMPWAATEAAAYRSDDQAVMISGQPRHNIIEPQHQADGRLAWFDTVKVPLMDDAGNVIGVLGTSRDITEQKQIEDKLRVSEERLLQAIRISDIGIFDHDQVTDSIYWSPEIRRCYGLSLDETFTMSDFIRHVHPDDLERTDASIRRAHDPAGDGLFEIEYRFIRRDGGVRWLAAKSRTFFAGDGEAKHPIRTIGALMDITERKRIEEERETLIKELEAKNAELERFTYTVSHDLKSPLVTIRGFLGFIERDALTGNTERLKGDLLRISDAVEKMRLLLSDLLQLSRVGRFFQPSEVIPFEELVHEALELVDGAIRERNITVKLQPGLPSVYGDRQRLVEVLQNLLDNASKFMGEQPSPCIVVGYSGEENGNPVFYVQDNGIGFAPEYREHVFGLFNKLDPKSEGSGVGLALVKRIIEVHGGRIWVESELGIGSTFYFTLATGRKSTQ